MSASEVSNALGLSALKSRTWSIFKTSATKGEGLDEAMEWLVELSLSFFSLRIKYVTHLLHEI